MRIVKLFMAAALAVGTMSVTTATAQSPHTGPVPHHDASRGGHDGDRRDYRDGRRDDDRRDWRGDRGRHHGWRNNRGRHRGWYNRRVCRTVWHRGHRQRVCRNVRYRR